MKINKEYGVWYFNVTENLFFHFKNDWGQLFGKYNWISMNFLQLYFEKDTMTHGYEFEFMVLGLGLRVRYNYDDYFNKVDKEIKELGNG